VERVRAGVKEAQRTGKHCGRPKRIFRRDQVIELRAKGMSLRAIAKQLKLPLTTVADTLKT
jgi:DNA invertase Pin-like site-specific DNA recombinase